MTAFALHFLDFYITCGRHEMVFWRLLNLSTILIPCSLLKMLPVYAIFSSVPLTLAITIDLIAYIMLAITVIEHTQPPSGNQGGAR